MKYLSVCSGIEAASVAWHPLGWEPLAFSEIEAFPRAVLEHHYPDTPLHGDFTVLRHEPWIVDADVLVGGTPCQAFSVAGLRKSLDDDRGNLSLEFIRLADAIDAAREAQGRDPSVIVWENVPGVLSVKDNAFGCFLAALAGDAAPYDPLRGKWTNAGVVDGPKRKVAWRVLDAQYFGLAQRRRRVFVVASAREGFDPAAVLLEFEGLRRDTPPRREAREVAPTIPSRSTAGGGLGTDFDCDGGVIRAASTGDISHCLNAGGMGRQDYETETLVTHALRGEGLEDQHALGGAGLFVPSARDTVSTLTARGPYSLGIPEVDGGQIVPVVANAITAAMGGSPTGHNREDNFVITHSLRAEGFDASEDGTGDAAPCVAVADTLSVGANQTTGFHTEVTAVDMAVRRLTPVECERLQGFPDNYTNIPWRGKPEAPDGPRYKALGNSMAVPVMAWIGRRIAEALK